MTDTQAPTEGYRWVVLASSVLVFTIAFGFGWTYIVMVVAQVLADLELELASWATLWSAISFGTLVSAMIGGALGDRYGVRKIVGLGVVLMGVTLLMRATATDFSSMYTWMFLFGIALALTFPNVPKALGMWFAPEEFGLANGATQAGYGVGAALALALTPLVLEPVGGWRTLTTILGGATIAIGVLWFVIVRDRAPEPSKAGAAHIGTLAAIRQVLSIRDTWILAVCHMLFLGGYIGIIGYAPTYFADVQGMTPATAGIIVSLVMWAFVVGALVLPSVSDRVGLRKRFYSPCMFIAGACMVLAGYALGTPLWIVALLWGFFAGAAPLAFVVPLEMEGVGSRLAGSAVGIAITAGYLGGVLAPVVGMWLVSFTPVAGFYFWGGCYMLSALLFLLLKETGPYIRTVG